MTSKSTETAVPKEKLRRTSHFEDAEDYDRVPQLLHRMVQQLSTTAYQQERKVLSKLIYKNKNQQKSSLHFRKLMLVKRCFVRLDALDLDSRMSVLLTTIAGASFSVKKSRLQCFPSAETLKVMESTTRQHQEVVKSTMAALEHAYMAYENQLAQKLFMPVSLTTMAVLSKLCAILKEQQENVVKPLLELLQQMMECLPRDGEPEAIEEDQIAIDEPVAVAAPCIDFFSQTTTTAITETTEITVKISTEPPSSSITKKRKSETAPEQPEKKPRKDKTKSNKNEIDDIFGDLF